MSRRGHEWAVAIGGPLDGLRFETRSGCGQVWVIWGVQVVYFRAPDPRVCPRWQVGRYASPSRPYAVAGAWALTWAGWLEPKPS